MDYDCSCKIVDPFQWVPITGSLSKNTYSSVSLKQRRDKETVLVDKQSEWIENRYLVFFFFFILSFFLIRTKISSAFDLHLH